MRFSGSSNTEARRSAGGVVEEECLPIRQHETEWYGRQRAYSAVMSLSAMLGDSRLGAANGMKPAASGEHYL